MKFFEVVAKCGHVGRQYYYEGHFFEIARDAKIAARNVKRAPRVKKDHDDVILSVTEIDEEAYLLGKEKQDNNPYFLCKSKWEQNLHWDEIKKGIRPETESQWNYREKNKRYPKKITSKDCSTKKGIRNYYKYQKFHSDDYNIYLEIV